MYLHVPLEMFAADESLVADFTDMGPLTWLPRACERASRPAEKGEGERLGEEQPARAPRPTITQLRVPQISLTKTTQTALRPNYRPIPTRSVTAGRNRSKIAHII